jgi:hypothetical protein
LSAAFSAFAAAGSASASAFFAAVSAPYNTSISLFNVPTITYKSTLLGSADKSIFFALIFLRLSFDLIIN